jgi:putative oxidoreductase
MISTNVSTPGSMRSTRLTILERVDGAFVFLQPILGLGLRVYVGWQFLASGYLKFNNWDTTLFLFENEYRVPVVSPVIAAWAGTAGELFFPLLLIIGFMSRLSAVGLFTVNAMAVFAYAHVLFSEGFEAALGQHTLWGLILVVLAVYGPGALSVDHLSSRRNRPHSGSRA